MSTMGDVLKGIRDTIALNDRLAALTEEVDRMGSRQQDVIERVVRIEAFIDFVKPAVQQRMLPRGES